MTKQKINILFFFLLTFFMTEGKAQTIGEQLLKLSDADNDSTYHKSEFSNQISYCTALQKWKTIYDVNNWIKENFRYSMERARQLAENSSTREKVKILTPIELYQINKGVCIDLSRFAVETINIIDSSKHVQYFMIEFEPIVIDSSILKKHWMATYQDSSGYHFLADSKRPGVTAGPYETIEDFISEYQTIRNRKIISWKVLPSYEKTKRKKESQQQKII